MVILTVRHVLHPQTMLLMMMMVAEKCMSQSRFRNQLEKFYWKDHCIIYKHDRTRKLALKSVGSETGAFLCGRSISDDYKEFTGTIACESWKCKQCDGCRPLHDVGSMIARILTAWSPNVPRIDHRAKKKPDLSAV